MKKLFALVIAIAMIMTCSLAMADRLADIQSAGKIVIATSPDWPPYEYYDDNNNVIGIEIEILKLVCEELGYELVTDETFSFAQDRWCVLNTTEEWVDKFIHKYNGFVQIYQVEQFDCPFQIWVPTSELDKAQEEVNSKFGRD